MLWDFLKNFHVKLDANLESNRLFYQSDFQGSKLGFSVRRQEIKNGEYDTEETEYKFSTVIDHIWLVSYPLAVVSTNRAL